MSNLAGDIVNTQKILATQQIAVTLTETLLASLLAKQALQHRLDESAIVADTETI